MEKFVLLENKYPVLQQYKQLFEVVAKCADEIDQPVYLVGGFVRDLLLERPTKDIDFVTVGSGIKLAEKIAEALLSVCKIYENFGTALVLYEDVELEFVGARKESYRASSRNPIVEEGTLEDDQNRRDFTINTLAIGLNKAHQGCLIDAFNGQEDLQNHIIRTPLLPHETFSDDPLRMLRAIRFASVLNFEIHPKTLQAIADNKSRINIISQERITDELNKIIQSDHPSIGFKHLFNTGLLAIIFPELANLQGVENRNGYKHKDNFYHTLEVLDNILPHSKDNIWLRWAALLHDIAKPNTKRFQNNVGWTFHGHEEIGARMVKRIFKTLKLPLDNKKRYVEKLVRLHLRPIALAKKEITDSAIRRLLFEAGEHIDDLMTLCRADITSKNTKKVKRYLHNFDLVEQKLKEVEEKDRLRVFQPPITGDMIMKTFDILPCKQIGMIKTAIKEAILEGEIENDIEQAKQYMFILADKMGLKQKI